MKKRAAPITSLQFFAKLKWLDGRNLLATIEPYRREIFTKALDTYRPDGSPQYNQVVAGRGKKNAKSLDLELAALFCTIIRRSVHGNDSLILANDEAQAGDDLELIRKLVARNPEPASEFDALNKELRLKDGSGGIKILPAGDALGLHGKTASFIGYDEIHGYRDWSVMEALQPDPTRRDALTWVTSYDVYAGEQGVPLHDLKEIGFAGSDPRMLFSWYSAERCTDPSFAELDPEARANPSMDSWPEGRAYLEQQRRRLPSSIYRRLHLNLGGSENAFIDPAKWDKCVDPSARPVLMDKSLPVFVAVDASLRHDSTAIVVCAFVEQRVHLITHKVFQPSPVEPLDLEATVEAMVLDLNKRFRVVSVCYDPWQLQSVMQRLARAGIRVEEFPQSPGNLTIASQNLYELIEGRNLVAYSDAGLRLAISRAVAIETGRGWKISKEKGSHKIDLVVSLAMACRSATQAPAQSELWSPSAFLVGDAPAPWPQRSAMIAAVLIAGSGAYRGQAAAAYFAKLDYTGRQPLLLVDCQTALLEPELLTGVVARCAELARELQAMFDSWIFTTEQLAALFPRLGYHGPVEKIDHWLTAFDEGLLGLRSSYYINGNRLKICAEAFAKFHPARFLDPTVRDDTAEPLKIATLLGTLLALEQDQTPSPSPQPPRLSPNRNLSNANLPNGYT